MSKVQTNRLSPIDRATRNTVVLFLGNAGYTVGSIAKIMNMSESTVSRVLDAKFDKVTLMDIIFNGK
jgi:DNA-binding NarL/FixJ family response regulator